MEVTLLSPSIFQETKANFKAIKLDSKVKEEVGNLILKEKEYFVLSNREYEKYVNEKKDIATYVKDLYSQGRLRCLERETGRVKEKEGEFVHTHRNIILSYYIIHSESGFYSMVCEGQARLRYHCLNKKESFGLEIGRRIMIYEGNSKTEEEYQKLTNLINNLKNRTSLGKATRFILYMTAAEAKSALESGTIKSNGAYIPEDDLFTKRGILAPNTVAG